MEKSVIQYQKAFNCIIDRFKTNGEVLAVMVFGSMLTGDLWDESDIDLFVVINKPMDEIKNIYTEENDVPVHIKLMSKEKFIQLYGEDLKGGFIHRIFASSRLVLSKDKDITDTYDSGRYYPDLDRERWTMVYLGSSIKNISVCKKYLYNKGIYTAYSAAVRCVEDFARVYVNFSGYMISKDAMTMAMNLNEKFKEIVDELFFSDMETSQRIEKTIKYIEEMINNNIKDMTEILVSFMRESDRFLSAEDIKNHKLFRNFDIDVEEILNKLWEKNIIKKESRDYRTDDNKLLFKENVYFI